MSAAAQSSGCALEGAARLETAQRGSCLANCCLASCAALEAASGLKRLFAFEGVGVVGGVGRVVAG